MRGIPCRFLLGLWVGAALILHPVPAIAQETPAGYLLGHGDTLAIGSSVQPAAFQEFAPVTEQGRIFAIRPDGRISLPLLGEVEVGGLTAAQVSRLLEERYKPFFGNARFVVNVVTFRPVTVALMGEVNRAGVFPFAQPPTLLEALSQGGGVTDWGDRRRIRVVRKQQAILLVDMERVIRGEQPNPVLQHEDAIHVDQVWYKPTAQTLPVVASMMATVATLIVWSLRR